MKWDPQKDSLAVQDNKLVFRAIPPGVSIPLDADTIRPVTALVFEELSELNKVTLRAKNRLLGYSSQIHVENDCADTIKIFLRFWAEVKDKANKILATAEAEDNARGKLSKTFANREEVAKLKSIINTMNTEKELPVKMEFTPHVERSDHQYSISETVLTDRTTVADKHVFRIMAVNEEKGCNKTHLSFEVHTHQYKPNHNEILISKGNQQGPVIRIVYLPTRCNKGYSFNSSYSHTCTVAKVIGILNQIYGEMNPSAFVIAKDNEDVKKIISRVHPEQGHLRREHPFFAALKS
jgi:hypothetical protein